jgi:hypothetical protein
MAFLEFTFASPWHFFGIVIPLLCVLVTLDSIISNICLAIIRRNK